jgi:ribosomal protein S18 acetylase RimI-like enzyme
MLVPVNEEHRDILQEHFLSSGENFFRNFAKQLPKFNERGNHYYLYFDPENNFAGYGMLRTFNKYMIPTLGCIIWKKYRRQGNGAKLVSELIAEARKLGYKEILLHTLKTYTVAINLYKKQGFKTIKIENNEISMKINLVK